MSKEVSLFSTENPLGAFLAGLHSSFPRTVMVSRIPQHYLTMKHFLTDILRDLFSMDTLWELF